MIFLTSLSSQPSTFSFAFPLFVLSPTFCYVLYLLFYHLYYLLCFLFFCYSIHYSVIFISFTSLLFYLFILILLQLLTYLFHFFVFYLFHSILQAHFYFSLVFSPFLYSLYPLCLSLSLSLSFPAVSSLLAFPVCYYKLNAIPLVCCLNSSPCRAQ